MRTALLIAAFSAGVLLPGPTSCAAQAGGVRFAGEHGLWVERSDDSVRVAWITEQPAAGRLLVLRDGQVLHELETPPGYAHIQSFRHRGGDELLLRYGAQSDEGGLHETRIDLDRPDRPRVSWSDVDSLFVVGDVHGELDTLTAVMRNAHLIDAQGSWTGGRRHIAFVGDLTDRGAYVVPLLWFLYRIEREAEEAGGRVHILLGNHELMVMLDDLRYVHPRELRLAEYYGVTYDRMFHPRRSVLGAWLASKPAVVRVDRALLAHGGVAPDYDDFTLESYDDSLRTFTGEELFARWADTTYRAPLDSAGLARRIDFFWGENSVFWYRGYALDDTLGDALASVLRRFRADVHVIGHTPDSTIRSFYDGRLLAVNTAPFAAEMLLLVRDGDGYQRYRYRTSGPPEAVPTGPPPPG